MIEHDRNMHMQLNSSVNLGFVFGARLHLMEHQ